MQYVVLYLFVLMLCLIPMYLITYYRPLKRDSLGTNAGFKFIVKKYDLSMDKKRVRLLSKIICIVNSFILSVPIYIVLFVDIKRIYIFIISFVVFMIGILVSYNIIGSILKKKGW